MGTSVGFMLPAGSIVKLKPVWLALRSPWMNVEAEIHAFLLIYPASCV